MRRGQHIGTAEHDRNGLGLDRGGRDKTQGLGGACKGGRKAQGGEWHGGGVGGAVQCSGERKLGDALAMAVRRRGPDTANAAVQPISPLSAKIHTTITKTAQTAASKKNGR